MNFVLKLIIFLSVAAIVYSDDEKFKLDDLVEAMMGFTDECEEPKPTKENAKEVIKFVKDAQKPSKCLRYCLMSQFNLITEGETRLKKDETVKMMSMMYSDADKDLEEIVEMCNDRNEKEMDKCENAHLHGICIYEELLARDYKMPEFEE
uniref:Odorant-binding protein 9 n=2 Tax=Delia TaxID=30063 RepID=A0A0P0UVW3_9MUSC|nr:odorant-binding protein [Delia antiqua]BAS69448.1 odorant-binding protein 9 [Delia platura]